MQARNQGQDGHTRKSGICAALYTQKGNEQEMGAPGEAPSEERENGDADSM